MENEPSTPEQPSQTAIRVETETPSARPSRELTAHLPPHARITSLQFDADGRTLRISIDNGEEKPVPAASVRALHATLIHHDEYSAPFSAHGPHGEVSPSTSPAVGEVLAHDLDWLGHKDIYTPVLALRVAGVDEVWFCHLDSFNYRHALGEHAALTLNANMPRFIEMLAAFCPDATRDPGYAALQSRKPAPVAISLTDFLLHARQA